MSATPLPLSQNVYTILSTSLKKTVHGQHYGGFWCRTPRKEILEILQMQGDARNC